MSDSLSCVRLSLNDERVLAVVMPCYNEKDTIDDIVSRVLASPLVGQVVAVDDGSTDGTLETLRAIQDDRLVVLAHSQNRGKGAALRTGFRNVVLQYAIIQDADLEYDPGDYPQMIAPLIRDEADVVYGSRFSGAEGRRVLYFWHSLGNRLLTLASNMTTNLNLTDMETCYKAFRHEILAEIEIQENRFGFEPEITAKVAALKCRVYEVGITYHGRTYGEGKKITWRDGLHALYCIALYAPIVQQQIARFGRSKRTGSPGPAG